MWRPEDEALLEQLEDEAVLERLWAWAVPDAPAPHPRAAGLIAWLRKEPGWAEAEKALGVGNLRPLFDLTRPDSLEGKAPKFVHHLALFHFARLHAIAPRLFARGQRGDKSLERSVDEAMHFTMAAWLALGAERTHLAELVAQVAGESGSGGKGAAPTLDRLALRGIQKIAGTALDWSGMPVSRPIRALRGIDDTLRLAGISDDLASRARAAATREADRVVAQGLAPILDELSELGARSWTGPEVREVFERLHQIWSWCDEDVEIERVFVAEIPRFAWDLYRDKKWTELRAILAPAAHPSDRLCARIERDPSQLAWAAQCAQVLVFRAELATTLDAQIRLAERGYRTCSTLRNARLVLADLLCARAERRLETPVLLRARDARDDARRDLERAESLYPDLRRLSILKRKLSAAGVR